MAYLSYTDYQRLGGTLDAAAFSRHEFRARQLIDALTHGRVRGDDPQREAVQRAMAEVIGVKARDAEHDGREVQAMGNDGVSVSYAATGAGGAGARAADIVCECLAGEVSARGVPLLYAGVDA